MLKSKKWVMLNEKEINLTKKEYGSLIQLLLENRGIISKKDQEEFLHPQLSDVSIASVQIDSQELQKTLARIQTAVTKGEQVIVYGDYDVDGITGTAILWETLHALSKQVLPFIPHRIDEGYGLSKKGIEHLMQKVPNIRLLITVDNGIVANEAVDYAREHGIDVIITDHHTKGEHLPNAYAIIHTTNLCGAGVGWILTKEIKKLFGVNQYDNEHLDLVSLATVADLVPLTNKNRAILKNGLPFLRNTKRVGLRALYDEAQIDPQTIDVYQIGHVIGPRINAMGRLESAMDSLRLLCTHDEKRAALLAAKLGTTNKDRQLLTQARSLHAKELVAKQELKNILIVVDESYEEGIIGLIAGKLVEEYYRPSIVIAKGEKVSKASARSVAGFNIIDFIRTAQEHLLNAGGHPMAAGFTIETEKITLLQASLEKLAQEQINEAILTRILKIECEIPLHGINQKLYDSLQQLAPFGMANPEPIFMSRNVIIEDITALGKEKRHLKLLLTTEDRDMLIEAIGFGMGELITTIKQGERIAIAYTIDENEWNGRKKLQLKLRDIPRVMEAG